MALLTTNAEVPVDFSSATNWPGPAALTNAISARWSGVVWPQAQGEHVFYVSAEVGAAFGLWVNGTTIIDNWSRPATNAAELTGTNWLGTNIAYDLRLEYAHFTNSAEVRLSWLEPGMTNKEVIAPERLAAPQKEGPTGVSVDSAGRIWAGCYDADAAVRIDPNAGPMAVMTSVVPGATNTVRVTNHVGLVDMVVDLGDGTWHQEPYKVAAHPYNYSDMTGFNERVVNPTFKPFKGYWLVVNDLNPA
jgi:hypothetical protein